MTKALSEMTTAELIERYNDTDPQKRLTSWKKSKEELVRLIGAAPAPHAPSSDDGPPADPQHVGDGPTARPSSIASLCEGLSNSEVADRVRGQAPGARTSPKSVAWYRARMKKVGRL